MVDDSWDKISRDHYVYYVEDWRFSVEFKELKTCYNGSTYYRVSACQKGREAQTTSQLEIYIDSKSRVRKQKQNHPHAITHLLDFATYLTEISGLPGKHGVRLFEGIERLAAMRQ